MKRLKKNLILFILIVTLSSLYYGCDSKHQNQTQSKTNFIDSNNIRSFKIHNVNGEVKEIKDKSDRDNIIDLVNSVKIAKSNVEPRDGIGYGVIITYSNGSKFSASYLSSIMSYTVDDKSTWCEINKNITNELKHYYDKN
ncbi:hypothetical protein [Clostridium manihotivorum]|uniref:Uncharacterized protein n=1 Tax=Clostridium manihotivorum TaxID=2320868 RepID=A0A410DV77_9CLOT|nr:hypothetical protein [Clostridium manihotivorum]QAA32947.1 hypothetical protein C1I91_15585 [Clostridium manihotivorum]